MLPERFPKTFCGRAAAQVESDLSSCRPRLRRQAGDELLDRLARNEAAATDFGRAQGGQEAASSSTATRCWEQSKLDGVRVDLSNLKSNYQSLHRLVEFAQQAVDLKGRDVERK